MMRILVTGGAGYIGSVVTEQLVEQGHAALVFDNLSKGHRDAVVEGRSSWRICASMPRWCVRCERSTPMQLSTSPPIRSWANR
jgi:nucleoside-diphosphate-sugar epimerase